MTYYKIKNETLKGIANAVRAKGGTGELYTPGEMAEAISQMETGGAKFNIAYGDTEPEDTSMLWVKTATPAAVRIKSRVEAASEELEILIGTVPVAAQSVRAVAIGTKLYLFGGSIGSEELNVIHIYDTETGVLSTLSTVMPIKSSTSAVVAVGNKVYLFGGATIAFLNTIYMFDCETNTFSKLSTTLPVSIYCMGVAAVGKMVYLFGGMTPTKQSAIYAFNTETNAITTLSTTLPAAIGLISAVAVGTKIYLFGGKGDNGILSTIHVFDTETHAIEPLGVTIPATAGACYSAVAKVGRKIYLFGGRTAADKCTNTIAAFDYEKDTISVIDASLPSNAERMGVAVVGASAYLVGGVNGSTYLNAIHRFTASFALPQNRMLIEASLTDNLVELVTEGDTSAEIGVANVYLGNADGIGEKVAAAIYKDGAWVEI